MNFNFTVYAIYDDKDGQKQWFTGFDPEGNPGWRPLYESEYGMKFSKLFTSLKDVWDAVQKIHEKFCMEDANYIKHPYALKVESCEAVANGEKTSQQPMPSPLAEWLKSAREKAENPKAVTLGEATDMWMTDVCLHPAEWQADVKLIWSNDIDDDKIRPLLEKWMAAKGYALK